MQTNKNPTKLSLMSLSPTEVMGVFDPRAHFSDKKTKSKPDLMAK